MDIRALSVVATPRKVAELVLGEDLSGKRILDLGAGQGFLTRLLYEEMEKKGLRPEDGLFAADLDPANYQFERIRCDKGDFDSKLPYDDGYFDYVCFVEVIEHLEKHFTCIREIHRVLKPGGKLYLTTPNIMNMNSRIRFFTSGLFLQFDLLPHDRGRDAKTLRTGHIHPIDYVHLAYILKYSGFGDIVPHVDRRKTSAVAWTILFYPLIKAWSSFVVAVQKKRGVTEGNMDIVANMNSFTLLTSRSLVLSCTKR